MYDCFKAVVPKLFRIAAPFEILQTFNGHLKDLSELYVLIDSVKYAGDVVYTTLPIRYLEKKKINYSEYFFFHLKSSITKNIVQRKIYIFRICCLF